MKQLKIIFVITLLSLSITSNALHLTIGVRNYAPPFVVNSGQNYYFGFDIELMHYICQRLEATCQYQHYNFSNLLDKGISNNEVDFAISGITITHYRLKEMTFSYPYLASHGLVLTQNDNKSFIHNPSDFEGKSIGVEKHSVYEVYLKGLHLQNVHITEYDSQYNLVNALMENKHDMILIDEYSARWWAMHNDPLKLGSAPLKIGEGYGIAVSEKAKQYLPELNQIILDWEKKGYFTRFYKQYLSPQIHQ